LQFLSHRPCQIVFPCFAPFYRIQQLLIQQAHLPGIGGLLINAINAYDNGVIVGVTLFYASISVLSMILGDVLMSMVDPRISFTSKAR
jgi:ABC-type microcin C transport system permease subunit YejB